MPYARSPRSGADYPRRPMIDLVVANPVFLDLTFVGLESLPALGEERFAAALARSPGGGAITAIGAARLGLSTAVAAPLGDDPSGDLVRAALADEHVELIATQKAPQTPTTVVLPSCGSRAMVTVDPGARASAADIAARAPRAVATNLDMLHLVPAEAMAYVTCGDEEARAFKGRPPAALAGSRALFVNRAEALALAGTPSVEAAAAALDGLAETVVVSLGADGALMTTAGEVVATETERVDDPIDTTGAGDLLAAAYIWADLRGAAPVDRLRWSVLYASLSVMTPTGIGGALAEDALVAAGTARGLAVPPLVRA